MWKKTGIVVAASAASLMALSPVAMAHGTHSGDHGDGIDKSAEGLIAGLNGNNVNVPIQACNNNIPLNLSGCRSPSRTPPPRTASPALWGSSDPAPRSPDTRVTDQSDNCAQTGAAGDTVKGHK
ncbi:hypothetical protein [Pseudonocardia sp. Ae717_Ps2]|uniref:hypothetical protein n=1 Tax=Pseudonocardia sp. Ae717_Ps2 TaxID=1885573 RepID=UPI001E291188|nr:hypothetical protein [Pseudonocardia sp. Ae717_Ps2]